MKHKVIELDGALLDAAVAKAEGVWSSETLLAIMRHIGVWRPSQNWAFGGPLIERERMIITPNDDEWSAGMSGCIDAGGDAGPTGSRWISGPTPLIAAMRAYVASKFGAEVELP